MIPMIEITRRALEGRPYLERDFDVRLFAPKVQELVREYGISYDPEFIVPSDDGLADSIFKAGFDLISHIGVYCKDTERIIGFEEKEIRKEIRLSHQQTVFGEGLEQGTLIPRRPESKSHPWIFAGAGGSPVSDERIFTLLVERAATMIPIADAITTPCLANIDGIDIRTRSPLEIEGSIRTVILGREALRRAGRPGLPIMSAIGTAESSVALASGIHPQYGLRKSDSYMIAELTEMKTDFDLMNRATFLQALGLPIAGLFGPIYGGYSGGAEGTAVTCAAAQIMAILVYGACWTLFFPIHINHVASSMPQLIWIASTYAQAATRNTNVPTLYYPYTAAGPCTEMALREFAAGYIATVASGASIETGAVAKGKKIDFLTPIEPMFISEVAYSSAGVTRADANEMVRQIVPRYIDQIEAPPAGKRFQECCNPVTGLPSKEAFHIYETIRNEIADIGIEFVF